MRRRVGRILLLGALAVLVALGLGRIAVGFYTDVLWYREVGYLGTYWTRLGLRLGVRAVVGAVGAALIFLNLWWVARHLGPVRVRRRYGNIEIAEQVPRKHVVALSVAVAVLGGWWLAQLQFNDAAVLTVASWLHHVPWAVRDPLFNRDVAFYVLSLPVILDGVAYLILVAVWSIALVALGHVLVGGIRWADNRLALSRPARLHLGILVAAMLVLLGLRYWLGRYLLVVDGHGVGGALGYADVQARLPAAWAMAVLAVAAAAALLHGAWHNTLLAPVLGLGGLVVGGFLLMVGYPALVQKFRVEPNELSREAPYIRWNLEFTRRAYGLDRMERQRFPYSANASPEPDRIEPLLNRLPLWDTEPLQRAFNQTQTLFQYYWFPDVDYDRYGPAGARQQVAIGVREFQPSGLEEGNRTWQSLRLNPSYIRGMGAVVAAAHPGPGNDGAPDLWVRNINPVVKDPAAPASLELTRPSVFYGERMDDYVIVVPGRDSAFTGQPGVAYPEGIRLSSFLRVLAFAWRFGDETLLFSGEVTRESRLLFRRAVRERVQTIAPFLRWDTNALPVISEGHIVWMLDGYTTSNLYPLARAVSVGRSRVRYLRNSVKAVVDGLTGEVSFYRVGVADPLLAAYERVFPDLVKPLDAMPEELRQHLRYPELALLTQAKILEEYHLQRAETFYAGQDVWQQPQQGTTTGARSGGYHPVYALMPVPLEGDVAYLGLVPFVARARQNMTAVLIARNGARDYGDLTLVELPRDQQIQGPGQVQAMIEQDPVISPELSLLRQRGSGVDMGHLRVVPLDSTVLYVQPLFVSAEENAIPELWRIVVSEGRNVNMAPSLAAAMAGLELPVAARRPGTAGTAAAAAGPVPVRDWPRQALELLDRAEGRLRSGDWSGYGASLDSLRTLLRRANRSGGGEEE